MKLNEKFAKIPILTYEHIGTGASLEANVICCFCLHYDAKLKRRTRILSL